MPGGKTEQLAAELQRRAEVPDREESSADRTNRFMVVSVAAQLLAETSSAPTALGVPVDASIEVGEACRGFVPGRLCCPAEKRSSWLPSYSAGQRCLTGRNPRQAGPTDS